MKSTCASECNEQCKEIIEKYQGMECFEELKTSIGEIFNKSLESCCESKQILCETSSNLSGGAIAGIVVGSVVGVAIIVGVLVFIFCKKSKNNHPEKFETDYHYDMQNIS